MDRIDPAMTRFGMTWPLRSGWIGSARPMSRLVTALHPIFEARSH